MSANSVLQLCDEIKPYLPNLTKGSGSSNSGRSNQWKKVQRNVNSRCDRAKILRRIKNNAKASNELKAYETYLRNAVLPGIHEYNQPYNVQPNNNFQRNNSQRNNSQRNNSQPNNDDPMLGGRRRKSRKSKKSRKARKTRKTRRSRK